MEKLDNDIKKDIEKDIEKLINEKVHELESEFVSNISHELRTPITAIKIAVVLLKQAPTEARRKIYLDIIESQCKRQIDYINQLLKLKDDEL